MLITYGSDLDTAEGICLEAARKVTADLIAESGQEPFIRRELADSGVRIRLRYQVNATERQRISSEIIGEVIRRFNKEPKVEFCYPHTEIVYRSQPNGAVRLDGPQAPGVESTPRSS